MTAMQRARDALYSRLQEVLGNRHAEVLMELLPPDPYPDLATRDDVGGVRGMVEALSGSVHHLADRMDRFEERMTRLETRMDRFEDQLLGTFRMYTRTTMASMTALVVAVIASQALF